MIKIADYVTVANIRLMAKLFTVGNIGDDAVNLYIDQANQEINSELGLSEDLTTAEVAKCNVGGVAANLVAFKCCNHDGTLYTNVSLQAMAANIFWAAYQNSLEVLKKQRGRAYNPTFSPKSNEDL